VNGLFEKVREFDGRLFRNIVSLRKTEDLFDDLVDDSSVTAVAYATEIQVKASAPTGKIPRGFHYSTAIGYPFISEPFMASRYGDGTYPVWYGSLELETTIHETAFHMVRNISDIEGVTEVIERERAVYRIDCQALLIDLEGKQGKYPQLVSDSYAHTQEIGRRLHREGHPGLLAPSARRCDGLNSVIFNEAVLSNPQNYCYLVYRYDPRQGTVEVERSVGEIMMRIQVHQN
jgi:hypothetical protein